MVTKQTGRVTPPKTPTQTMDSPTVATPASEWKKETVEGILVRVPSGKVIRMRTPGMQVFLKNGTIPNALMPVVQESMVKGKGPSEEDLSLLLQDEETINRIVELADAVLVECAIEPPISPAPRDGQGNILALTDERRDINTVYADEVGFDDKMFIFNVAVGGPSRIEAFR